MHEEKFQKIKEIAKANLSDLRWVHTQDVVDKALKIAEEEGADEKIVGAAAWLHDIGASEKKDEIIYHHLNSAKKAREILADLDYSDEEIEKIAQCIKEHMGPPGSKFLGDLLAEAGKDWDFFPRPSSKEARVLYDADMINLCSPFGAFKLIALNAKQGKDLLEIIPTVQSLTDKAYNSLMTESGKKLGEKEYSRTENFMHYLTAQRGN